jgi:dTDP-4-amino-4,6-dideoxygalactose transaminase
MDPRADVVRFVDLQAQIHGLQPAINDAINEVIHRGDFILGQAVTAFEDEWARFCGVKHAVGVDSGLSAIELALRAGGIGQGDEVITQANTFIATVGAVMAVCARPVLVDCNGQGQVDVAAIQRAITKRTRAILPVHLFGLIGDIDGVLEVAGQAGLRVIEDACQAHGAAYRGRRAGSFGWAAAFSFYPAKNLGAFGDAGILVTDDDDLAETVRRLRNYGSKAKYEHIAAPLNHRLDTIQAAVLRVKLPHLDGWNHRRKYLADAYREHLSGGPVELPASAQEGRHVYHLFVVQAAERDTMRAALTAAGIETGVHYPIPLHAQPVLRSLGYQLGPFPNAERLAAHSLSLPMYPELPLAHIERVAEAITGPGIRRQAA